MRKIIESAKENLSDSEAVRDIIMEAINKYCSEEMSRKIKIGLKKRAFRAENTIGDENNITEDD